MESIEQAGLDRWCKITLRHHNTIGDLENLYLYIELMGKYANIILVSEEGKIIDALKRIPPFENSRRIIQTGAMFVPAPSQNKKDPFVEQTIDPELSLTKQFAGFSPFLAKECEYRMAHGQSFSDFMKEIEASRSLYIADDENEPVFHCIPLQSVGKCVSYPLFEGFDVLYYHREEKDRIRQITGDVYHVVSRNLKHQQQKLPRLLSELDTAMDCDKYRLWGDLLYTYNVRDTKGQNSINLVNYEDPDQKEIRIPLDVKLDGPGNARKFYARYNKLKKGQTYVQEQIDLCKKEIDYLEGMIEQLDQADFTTASEIREELKEQGYLRNEQKKVSKSKARKKKKDALPHITEVKFRDSLISFGRNNLQNDALTWHIARRSDLWLHAKDYHGAHVVIHSESPQIDEDTLRFAANVAAYFSKGRNSSSVPVNYCPVRNLKKIPGAKPGMVQLGAYKTIYIDPDGEQLEKAGINCD